MKDEEITAHLLSVLQARAGLYMTSYQVCLALQKDHSAIWSSLRMYGEKSGKGAGQHYSPASFVANALSHLASLNGQVQQALLLGGNVVFGSVDSSVQNVGIWIFVNPESGS